MTGFIPSGGTRLFPVVGDPIAQVRSPEVITPILADRGQNALVVPMHIAPMDLAQILAALHRVHNLEGALITIPHKRAALSLCMSVTDRARFVQSVNVVRRTDDGWHGDNTDGQGYLNGIEREGFVVRGKRALLVGCGGAGAAEVDGRWLRRKFKFSDFREAQGFIDRVGRLAEEQGHHPDICFGWGYATVSLQTHKIKGLHENDFIMAGKISELAGL